MIHEDNGPVFPVVIFPENIRTIQVVPMSNNSAARSSKLGGETLLASSHPWRNPNSIDYEEKVF